MIIIPTRSPSVSQSTAVIASSMPKTPAMTTTPAPTSAAFVRWSQSNATTASTPANARIARTVTGLKLSSQTRPRSASTFATKRFVSA